MGHQFRDYDAAWKEQADEPILFGRVHGEDIELPAKLPAKVALGIVRIQAEFGDDEQIPPDVLLQFGAELFGGERVDRWLGDGMPLERFAEVFEDAIRVYMADDVEEGDGGGPPAPARKRSSNGGRSSKRTSRASTDST